jgi:hypothetical protein
MYATGEPLEVVLERSPDWQLVYQDKVASVLVRRGPGTATYLSRHTAL